MAAALITSRVVDAQRIVSDVCVALSSMVCRAVRTVGIGLSDLQPINIVGSLHLCQSLN